MMDATFGFECGKCNYSYEHRMGPHGLPLRIKGERTPLVFRLMPVSDCTPTPGEIAPPPILLIICPKCGDFTIAAHPEQMQQYIARTKLPILPSAEGMSPFPPMKDLPKEDPPTQEPPKDPPKPPRGFLN